MKGDRAGERLLHLIEISVVGIEGSHVDTAGSNIDNAKVA